MSATSIPGYTYGEASLATSPVTLDELELLHKTVLFGEADARWLRATGEALAPQVEAILDVWYGFVGSQPHLLASFSRPGGDPDPDYLAAVRKRFGQWILDLCNRPHDQAWLDYQHEVALRHHRAKKNRTDGVDASAIVPMRDLIGLIVPITVTIRPFLEKSGQPPEAVEQMHQAWFKAVTLSVVLWSQPYARDGDF